MKKKLACTIMAVCTAMAMSAMAFAEAPAETSEGAVETVSEEEVGGLGGEDAEVADTGGDIGGLGGNEAEAGESEPETAEPTKDVPDTGVTSNIGIVAGIALLAIPAMVLTSKKRS